MIQPLKSDAFVENLLIPVWFLRGFTEFIGIGVVCNVFVCFWKCGNNHCKLDVAYKKIEELDHDVLVNIELSK